MGCTGGSDECLVSQLKNRGSLFSSCDSQYLTYNPLVARSLLVFLYLPDNHNDMQYSIHSHTIIRFGASPGR